MFILFILYFLKVFHLFSSNIVIPFITVKENFTTDGYSSTFMYHNYPNKIETKMKIGTPGQEISLRIKTFQYPISINSVQMEIYKVIQFNESDSSTYIPLNERPTYFGENDFSTAIKSLDTINFNNISMKNFTFLLGITQNENHRESGVLGLKIPEFDWRINNVSFIKQLKERELIHKYNFYIQYNDNDDNGNLVIGSLPHENDPQKYNKDKYDEFYATIVMSSLGLRVKKAFYGDEVIDYGFNVELAVEDNFIKGNNNFKNILMKNYFQRYFDRRICQSSKFSYLDNRDNEFFYCSKKLNLSEFKNIILSIDNSELTIELNYNDLFYEYEDYYYFLMYFPNKTYSTNFFRFGKALFKKYAIIFNYDSKMIGYYKEDKKETNGNQNIDQNEKLNYNFVPWIIIIILVLIVLGLVFYILYYKPCNIRAKRANELKDDDYTYQGINE